MACMAKKATSQTSEVILPLHSETVTFISSPGPSAKHRQGQHDDKVVVKVTMTSDLQRTASKRWQN